MKLKAKIVNKTITFENLPYARHHLGKLEGKTVLIDVQKLTSKRSLNQNSYYWLCLQVISDHTGHAPEELHRLFKGLFLPRKEIILHNRKFFLAGSTTDLTKGQFVEYMMRITAEVAEMGIVLPSPDDFRRGLDAATFITE